MVNPIFSKTSGRYAYLFVWVLIAGIHGGILTYFYEIDPWVALIDSVVFNGLFCVLGLSLWYVVRFVNVETQGLLYILFTHLAAAALVLLLWLSLGKMLTAMFLTTDDYQLFMEGSLPWRVLIGLLFYSVIVLVYYLIKYYGNFQEKIQQEASLNTLVKESELAMLRSQINPHFIFNSLNSISSLTMGFPEKAQEMTIKLSDFLRYSLAQDGRQLTTLAEEMSNVSLYMDIEKTRFGSRLKFESQMDVNCLDKLLPNMILQPLFENAIKHGVYESLEEVTIRFRCDMHHGALKLSLWNNFDPEGSARKGSGTGLHNIRKRLHLLYGRQDLLTVQRTDHTYEVGLTIPQL